MTAIQTVIPVDPLAGQSVPAGELLSQRQAQVAALLQRQGRTAPLRVLLGSNSLGCGGTEHQILRLMPHLADLGLQVEHCYYSAPHFLQPRFAERRLPSHFIDRQALGQWRFWRRTIALLRDGGFDVLHAFNGTANFYLRGAAALAGVPVIIGGWRNRPMAGGVMVRAPLSLLNLVSQAWVINAASNREALERLWGMGRLRTYVVPNVLDFHDRDYAVPVPLEAELRDWVGGRLVVGTVGTISRQKNFDLFLDVARRFALRNTEVCFCLVGGAEVHSLELERHLRRRVATEGLAGYVRLLGNSANVAGVLPHFAVFLCTSDYEGCPNVVMEAMRARLPVLMTACCSSELLVEEGENGHVVPTGAVEPLAGRLAELLADPVRRRRFGRRARELAESHFTASENAWLMARIYLDEWTRRQPAPH